MAVNPKPSLAQCHGEFYTEACVIVRKGMSFLSFSLSPFLNFWCALMPLVVQPLIFLDVYPDLIVTKRITAQSILLQVVLFLCENHAGSDSPQ